MTVTTLQLTLTLKAPYLTQSSTPTDYGIDVPFAKNYKNQYCIPSTLLMGKLREAWQELNSLSAQFPVDIEQWLGQKSDPKKAQEEPESTVEPQRKQLFIEDLVLLAEDAHPSARHYRIHIDPELGSVEKGAYLVAEKPFATGAEIVFQGYARFLSTDEAKQQNLIFCLKKGLQWINQVGANRTIGFGELLQVEVEPATLEAQATLSLSASSRYGLQLRPHAPFCLAERRIAGNLFRSDETISGGAIKGILAMMCSNNLPEYFSHIGISHAFPSNNAIRPLQFPLSMVKVGKRYYDVALCETPVLFCEQESKELSAPAFSIDWKDNSEVRKNFGWPQIKRELRVRTAIDSEKRRSEEEQLFAYEMVSPLNKQGEPLNWLAYIDLSQVPKAQQSRVINQLQNLTTHSLLGLGKTKTVVDAKIIALDDISPCHLSQLEPREGWYIITLQTPALLCDPQQALPQAYYQTWQQLSDNSLELVRFFATQTLAGGHYFWKRFQDRSTTPQPYQPYLLTNAGSVFVLKPVANQEQTAQAYIRRWFDTGVPIAHNLLERYALSAEVQSQWQQCPYIPQNGYGEVAVNLPVHWVLRPQEGDFEPIPEPRERK